MLKLIDLHCEVADKKILKGLNLEVSKGEIHVIMGPNGVGKSTLGHILMANRSYPQWSGMIKLNQIDITHMDTAERAQQGLFLAFQYPVSIPGLKISEFLRTLYTQRHNVSIGVAEFRKILKEKLDLLNLDRSILQRYLNDGFSGGEMKRLEMLQLLLLEPKIAILDEIDSGVDVDAQKIVAESINYAKKNYATSFILITHYQRLLSLVNPDKIHILLDGIIHQSGDMSLVNHLEQQGYDWVRKNPQLTSAEA